MKRKKKHTTVSSTAHDSFRNWHLVTTEIEDISIASGPKGLYFALRYIYRDEDPVTAAWKKAKPRKKHA